MRETIAHAEQQFNSSLDGNNNYIYIYGRREYEDIRDSTKFELYIYIYLYLYIYIYILSLKLTYIPTQ